MNGVEINTRAYVATRLLLRWDYLYAVTLKTKVFGDYNHARLEVSWITSTRGLLLRGYRRAAERVITRPRRSAPTVWAFIDLRGTRNFDDVCWVAALRLQSLPETAKICRKNTNNGEWTIHRRGKEAQVAKNKKFPLTCCWGRHFEGTWSCQKSLSTPSRTSNWRKMRANSGKSTAIAVDLRAVVRRWVSERSPRARHNQNNRRSPVFDPWRSTLRTDTRMCSPLEKQADTSPSLDRFRFHRTELQLQLRLFHPPYCTPLLVVASAEWLHYFAKKIKNGNKIVARRQWRSAAAFRSHH